MGKIPFSELEIRPQNRKRISHRVHRDNIGVDTETFEGRVKLVCDSFGKFAWINSIDDLLAFLTRYSYRRKMAWFWNIKFDFESIAKWLPRDNIMDLYERGETDYERFHIHYLDGKYFEINERKNKYRFYDMTNFLQMSLESASQRYLKVGKLQGVDGNLLNTDKQYWVDNKDRIVKYCLRDALLTKQLADWFWTMMNTTLELEPHRPYSCGSYSQDYFLHKCHVPRVDVIPREVLQYAYESYYGGRFELLQRGYFSSVYSYDLKSAYPAIISELPDYTFGNWHFTDEFNPDYSHGFYKCYAWPDEKVISPIMYKNIGLNCYCNGVFTVYLTAWEIRYILEHMPDTPLTIMDGYYWVPDAVVLHPFKKEIERLYAWKEKEKDDDVKFMIKLVLNALSGKFFQTIGGKTGKLFNPLYASECSAKTRIKLLEAARLCGQDHVISFSTDAIHTNKPFEPIKRREDSLGDFVLDFTGEGIYIQSDIYSLWNDTRKKDRFRGMYMVIQDEEKRTNTKQVHDILKQMGPLATVYPYLVRRPVHLKEAISQPEKKGIEAINRFHDTIRYVNINGDHKRIWPRDFVSAEEVLSCHQSSVPRTILNETLNNELPGEVL